jgi:hypothetical protein
MMKSITITQAVNLPRLTEELFEAFPDWKRPDPLGRAGSITDVIITGTEIIFPDATETSEVEKVLRKHDPGKDSANQERAKRRQAARGRAVAKLRQLGLDEEEIDALAASEETTKGD